MRTLPDLHESVWRRFLYNINHGDKPLWMVTLIWVLSVAIFPIISVVAAYLWLIPDNASELRGALTEVLAGLIGVGLGTVIVGGVGLIYALYQQREEARIVLRHLTKRSDLSISPKVTGTSFFISITNSGPSDGRFYAKIESISYFENGAVKHGRHIPFNARWRLGDDNEDASKPNWMPISIGDSEALLISNLGGTCTKEGGNSGAEVTIYACNTRLQEQLCADFFCSIELEILVIQDGHLSQPMARTIRFKALREGSKYWWDESIEMV